MGQFISTLPISVRRMVRVWRLLRWALALATLILVGGALTLAITVIRYGTGDRARPADVIVVLGGGEAGTVRRAEHAAALYHAGYAPSVLCTGGAAIPTGDTEAARCAQVMEAEGVPAAAVWREETSHSTAENARATAALMAAQGWRDAVLVSDDFHLWRARWLFEREGVRVYPSPAQRTTGPLSVDEEIYAVLRELAAWSWQALPGH
ncbi:MAG: YdcF family protein [Anaerolineae bacterium]